MYNVTTKMKRESPKIAVEFVFIEIDEYDDISGKAKINGLNTMPRPCANTYSE